MESPVSLASLKFILWHSWWIFVRHLYNQNGSGSGPKPTKLHWASLGHPSFTALLWPDTTVWAGPLMALTIPTINQPDILQLGDLSQKPMKNSSQFSNPNKKTLKTKQIFYPTIHLVGIQTTQTPKLPSIFPGFPAAMTTLWSLSSLRHTQHTGPHKIP